MTNLAANRKAFHDYAIEDTFEAGLLLTGHEVKSVRNGNASLNGAFVTIRNGEAFLRNAYIGKYKQASNLEGYDESQERKLLLSRDEINKLSAKTKEKGLTLVPLEIYSKKHWLKLKVGIGRGKKRFDKRESIKKKEDKRKIERMIRTRTK